ncbi:DUF4013 domain-containing protein [Salinigranum marinum]|uniref:DUF4013 domain-containing protein n=1 Tax=Salinigranum marinum TaxID=1515595 RepID=UPI002989A659|nr:DUF4013 domain-containing protein [Salinigranum marinum]
MDSLDPRPDDEPTHELLDTAFPVALLVAVASWLPASVLLLGYAVRVLRAELVGDDDLPPLDDVRSLARTGISAATVVVAYQLPALLVTAAAFASMSSAGLLPGGDPFAPSASEPAAVVSYYVLDPGVSVVTAVGFVLAAVAFCLTSYAGTVALVVYAARDRLGAAFDTDTVRAGVRSSSFRRGYLLALLAGFVGSGVAWVVAVVPVVGPFAAAFVELFVLVGALRLVADGYDGRVTRGERSSPPHEAGGADATGGVDAAA